MNADEMKKMAAKAALDYVEGGIVGVGTGSTVNHFIDYLSTIKNKIEGAVSSSEVSTERMKGHGIPVLDLNAAGELPHSLQQQGWRVEYQEFGDFEGYILPTRFKVSQGDTSARIILRRWEGITPP